MKIVVLGCGFLGIRLAAVLAAAGHEVVGVSREPILDRDVRTLGIRHATGDVTSVESMASVLRGADSVVNCVSSSRGGLEVYQSVYLEGTRNILRVLESEARRVRYVHVSSTSVYAQTDGGWVDESSEAEGGSDTSRVLVAVERMVLAAGERGGLLEPVVVRAAGIYGPGRGHLFLKYLDGEARMAVGGEQWINMVHVDDLAAACAMLPVSQGLQGIYNASDDEPVTHAGFFEWLSKRLGRPMPPPEEAGARVGRKRGQTHKRVSNARLRALDSRWLAHPTFREGYEKEIRRLGLG